MNVKIVNKLNWLLILHLLLLTAYCMPMFSDFLHGLVFFLPLLLGLLFVFSWTKSFKAIVLIIFRQIAVNRALLALQLWYFIGLFFALLRGGNNWLFFFDNLIMIIYFMFGLFISRADKYLLITVVSLVFFLFINTVCKGSEIGFNMTARDIIDESGSFVGPVGAAGYWGIIGIFFPIFLLIVKDIKSILLLLLYILVIVYLTFKLVFSGFTTALGLLLLNVIIMTILYIIFIQKSKIKSLLTTLFSVVIFFGLIQFFNLIMTTDITALSDVQWRVINVVNDPTSGGYSSDHTSRYDLFKVSLETFERFPIFGAGVDIMTLEKQSEWRAIGGHSSFIDIPANLGLLGGGASLLFFFLLSLLNAYHSLKKNRGFDQICHLSVVITLMVGGILNPYWMGSIFCIYLLVARIYRTSC